MEMYVGSKRFVFCHGCKSCENNLFLFKEKKERQKKAAMLYYKKYSKEIAAKNLQNYHLKKIVNKNNNS